MANTERGIIVNSRGDVRTVEEIRTAQLKETAVNQPKPKVEVGHWLKRAKCASQGLLEDTSVTDGVVRVTLPDLGILSAIGDIHEGNARTDYDRVEEELTLIHETRNSFVLWGGDLVHGIFWGGTSQGEQAVSLEHQFQFLTSLFDMSRGKTVVAVSGEHDSKWASKTGIDPYSFIGERNGAAYVRGVAEVEVTCGSQRYNLVVAHKLRGSSIYNNAHPEMRAGREIAGADAYIGFHTHRKAITQQPAREFGGERLVTYVSGGPYCSGDDYAQREGFIKQMPHQLFGAALRFHGDEKRIDVDTDIIYAHRKWGI